MVRPAALAYALVLASCARGGVEIIVQPDSETVTRVELFLGVGDETIADLMITPEGPLIRDAMLRERDRNGELDVRDVVAGQPVTFQFVGDNKLHLVVAVGWDAQERAVSAQIVRDIRFDGSHISQFHLDLVPLANNTAFKLRAWKPKPGSPLEGKTCVLVQEGTRPFEGIVTPGDPDCDGYPTDDPDKECRPTYYDSYTRPALDEITCIATETVTSPDATVITTCLLAGPSCQDGQGKDPAASCTTTSQTCLPMSVCTQCGMDLTCARDITKTTSTQNPPSHLRCYVYVDGSGNICAGRAMKALNNPAPDVFGRNCLVGADTPGLITYNGASPTWDTRASFADVGGNTLDVEIRNLSSDCNFEIVPTGGHLTGETLFAGLVAGKLDNGRGISFPIVFELSLQQTPCTLQPITCSTSLAWPFGATERFAECINQPVFPPE